MSYLGLQVGFIKNLFYALTKLSCSWGFAAFPMESRLAEYRANKQRVKRESERWEAIWNLLSLKPLRNYLYNILLSKGPSEESNNDTVSQVSVVESMRRCCKNLAQLRKIYAGEQEKSPV